VARAYRTGRPQTRLAQRRGTPEDDQRRQLALPLTIGSRTLGVLAVMRVSDPTPFSDDDVAFAEELARRMARAIENARLYHERDQIATVLQQSLLPGALPEIPGLSLAAHYEAAGEAYEVGGDFYDMIALGPSSWLFVVGDVCGKGPEAAAVMGFARASIRAAAQKDGDPESILVTLNRALISQGWNRFVTAVCVRVDRDGGRVRVRSAVGGHPRPVLAPADAEPVTLGSYGTVLGIFPDVELNHAELVLGAGDSIVLYTDGLEGVEASAEDVVMSCVRRATSDGSARSIVRVLEEVRRSSRRAVADDLALLVISVPH
jgi:serine phosphatase RsbU (regulator of sigma subunit)